MVQLAMSAGVQVRAHQDLELATSIARELRGSKDREDR